MKCLFVCLDFVHFFPPTGPRSSIGPRMGCQFFKKMLIFPTPTSLIQCLTLGVRDGF